MGIVSTTQYMVRGYDMASTAKDKERAKETHDPAAVVALNDSIKYDVVDDQKVKAFATSQNPADITMCDDKLRGCQSFDILVSTDSDLVPSCVSYWTNL
ncbi:hypothetical protein PG994_002050 [Apiospora phragmitis]|uniref:Uncharacterized protein n=1 Tax=Apiospora phragmitis TaxID=2905665 RepID=A0ABR1WVA4_9PEZI